MFCVHLLAVANNNMANNLLLCDFGFGPGVTRKSLYKYQDGTKVTKPLEDVDGLREVRVG